jgi:thiosulfate/3-mercaptopyruvate sulfurtransferase
MKISYCLRISLIIASILFLNSHSGLSQINEGERVSPIVSADWLKQNISKPGIIILHVTPARLDYENGHIPGARFLWPGYIIISTENESTIPAPAEQAAKKLKELGINNDSRIILCGIYGNVIQVCRVFVNLEHYGLRGKVSILNGGFEAWKNAGYESSTTYPVTVKGKFGFNTYDNLAGGEFVRSALNNSAYTIIDARPKNQYDGSAGSPRAGHIPGAKNLPQADMYDSKSFMFYEAGQIRDAFEKINIPPGSRPIVYCHIGNSASIVYVASIIAGYEPLLYDGSIEEWGSHFDWPMEKGD